MLGAISAAPGAQVKFRFQGMTIPGEIVRIAENEFAIRFDDTLENRATLIRHIYAGSYLRELSNVRPSMLGLALARRFFR